MRAALAIAKKELNVYFTTPIAYVMFMVVAFFAAQFFNGGLDAFRFLSLRAMQLQNPALAEHLTAEYRVKTEARGRAVDEWKAKPGNPDRDVGDRPETCHKNQLLVG